MYNVGMSSQKSEKLQALRQFVVQQAGQKLPGERELAEQLQLSRPTIRLLLDTLEGEGLIARYQGSGTYAVDAQAVADIPSIKHVSLLIDANLKLGDDPFFLTLVELLQAELQAQHINCSIERFHQDTYHPQLRDGAIVLGLAGARVVEKLKPADPPVVGLFFNVNLRPQIRASLILADDRAGGAQAASMLIEQGCRELLFIGKQEYTASLERYRGAEEVARAVGIALHFHSCALNFSAGLRLGQTLELAHPLEQNGIIATNDWLALGLQTGLLSRGQVVKMLSFDGLPITSDPALHITSLAVPLTTIAHDALSELQRLRSLNIPAGRTLHYQFTVNQD